MKKDLEIIELEYIGIEEANEYFDNVFVFDGNDGAWTYSSDGDYYGIFSPDELDEEYAVSIEGYGKSLSCNNGFKYVFDFKPFEDGLKHGIVLRE